MPTQVYHLQAYLPCLEELHLCKNGITTLDPIPSCCSSPGGSCSQSNSQQAVPALEAAAVPGAAVAATREAAAGAGTTGEAAAAGAAVAPAAVLNAAATGAATAAGSKALAQSTGSGPLHQSDQGHDNNGCSSSSIRRDGVGTGKADDVRRQQAGCAVLADGTEVPLLSGFRCLQVMGYCF